MAIGLVMSAISMQLKTGRARSRLESEAALVKQRLELAEQENNKLQDRVSHAEANASANNREAASLWLLQRRDVTGTSLISFT